MGDGLEVEGALGAACIVAGRANYCTTPGKQLFLSSFSANFHVELLLSRGAVDSREGGGRAMLGCSSIFKRQKNSAFNLVSLDAVVKFKSEYARDLSVCPRRFLMGFLFLTSTNPGGCC